MSLDAQTIVDTIAAADDETVLSILNAIIQSRPELAQSLVSFIIPDITFPPAKAIERRFVGAIKSLNREKGFGFIDCAELHEAFGNDVFLHVKQAHDWQTGQAVSFAVMMNKEGKPQAYDLTTPDAGKKGGKGGVGGMLGGKGGKAALMSAMDSFMNGWGDDGGETPFGGGGALGPGGASEMMAALFGGKDGGKDGKKGKKRDGPMPGKPDEHEVVGEFQGVIKSFNPKSGYGFISCPDLKEVGCPNDVFLHHQQLGGFEVGSTVQFTVYMNSKGQPQAKDLADCQGASKKLRTE